MPTTLDTPIEFLSIDIADVSDDDRVWTVRCGFDALGRLYADPMAWMAALTAEAIRAGKLAEGDELRIESNLTIKLTPVLALNPPLDHFALADHLLGFGAPGLGPGAPQQATALVTGIHGTGYITVKPSVLNAPAVLANNPDWQAYWGHWTSPNCLMVMEPNPVEGVASLHMDLTEEGDSREVKGDKIAAFLICGTWSVTKLNALIDRAESEGHSNGMPIQRLTPQTLQSMPLLYITDLNANNTACEVGHAEIVTDPVTGQQHIVFVGLTTKDYAVVPRLRLPGRPDPTPGP